jgi:hypothetical protein
MAPAATTPRTSSKGADGHRRTVRRQAGAAAPRRVSGPARGRAAAAAGATVPAPARPRVRPGERRIRHAERGPAAALALGVQAFLRSLPDHALVDRAVRGRAWIPILGAMLVGIVAMQVEVLKLGTSIGRAIERGSALQSRNELLRANVSSLADDQRIERLAAGMGMVMPPPVAVGFLNVRPANAARAAGNIHAPDPSAFLSAMSSLEASAATPLPTTSATGASSIGSVGTSGTGTVSTGAGTAPTATGTASSATATPSAGTPATGAGTASSATTPAATSASSTAGAVAPPGPSTSQTGGTSATSGG